MTEDEFEAMPGKIERYFDRIRELLAEELGGEPGNYESDDLDRKVD